MQLLRWFYWIKNGRDRSKLTKLQAEKDVLQSKSDKLYAEYEELMKLIWEPDNFGTEL